jgi:hypothetical protein
MTRALLVYDVQTGRTDLPDNLGLSGFMSFQRLARLIQSHECRGTERLDKIVVTDDGLQLRFKL